MNEIKATDIYTYKTEGRVILEVRHAEAWQAFAELCVANRVYLRSHDWRNQADAQRSFDLRTREFKTLLEISRKPESWWAD